MVKSVEYPVSALRVFTEGGSDNTIVPRRSYKKVERAIGGSCAVSAQLSGQTGTVSIDCTDANVGNFGLTLIDMIVRSTSAPVIVNPHDSNLLMHAIPACHIPYIMGRNQQYMSALEEELGVVCFICDDREAKTVSLSETETQSSSGFAPMDKFLHLKKPSSQTLAIVWVAIFSTSLKARVAMKLKLMNAIESKMKGYYTVFANTHQNLNTTPYMHYSVSGLAVDTFPIAEEELSLALGKSGANKRRVAATSGCVVEYVGRCAFMFGTLEERKMARNFLTIVLERGRGIFQPLKWFNAVGLYTMEIPADKVGIVTGRAGVGLHQIEDSCTCMCFMEGNRQASGSSPAADLPGLPPPVLRQPVSPSSSPIPGKNEVVMVILGTDKNTEKAARMIRERMGVTPSMTAPKITVRANDTISMFRQIFRNNKLVADGNDLYTLIVETAQAATVCGAELNCLQVPADISDVTVMEVPSSQNLHNLIKQLEDDFGVLCGTANLVGGPPESAFVVIVGPLQARRAVELKIMSTVETKQRGYYSHRFVRDKVRVCDAVWSVKTEGFDTDTVPIPEDQLSFALGQKGSIRKKLALASHCIIEYVGECAYLSGTMIERARARDYLRWVLQQLEGEVTIEDYENRIDVSATVIPKRAAGFVNGNKGRVLRNVEEVTGTFCFIGQSSDGGTTRPLFVCGPVDSHRNAAVMLLEQYIKRHEGSDWMNDATEASLEMEKDLIEKRMRELGIECGNPLDPWKSGQSDETGKESYRFVCQPCPGAARPKAELLSTTTTSPILLRKRSKKNSSGKFVNDEESFPELGGAPKRTSWPSPPPPPQDESILDSPESPASVHSPRSQTTVVAESLDKKVDAGIVFDYANGQVWGDWGLGPNGDPTSGKPARKSLGGVRSVSVSPQQTNRSGVWK